MKSIFALLIFLFSMVFLLQIYSLGSPSDAETKLASDPAQSINQGDCSWVANGSLFYWCAEDDNLLTYLGSPLSVSLAIAGTFLGLGLLAGVGGAGALAYIIAALGIGLAMINYVSAFINLYFPAIPFALNVLITGFLSVFYIYMIIKLLRGF